MLGGGTWTKQNKVLPGVYHNFISLSTPTVNLSERGYVALPFQHDFGVDDKVLKLTAEDFQKNSLNLLGYDYNHEKLTPFRELFRNAHTVYVYFLKGSTAKTAENEFAKANFKGTRGNDLKIVILSNVDDPTKFDVQTYLDATLVDEQKGISDVKELVPNDFVTFKADATLSLTAGTPLQGGANGTVTPADHQKALDEFESLGFNVLACDATDSEIKALYEAYTIRLREAGSKFQLVVHDYDADHEGIITIHNKAVEGESKLVYWTAGAQAGAAVNESTTNKVYDGEYTVDFEGAKTQRDLEELLKAGKYVFHRVGDDVRILEDINSLVTYTETKGPDFSSNQVIRVLDQIAIDTANIFNDRYLGKVPNDQSGRMSLWNDIVTHRLELQGMRAIEEYDKESLTIEQGEKKKSVVMNEVITPIVAMTQLYITTVIQ